ncbi:MAG: type II toxin-antitoxin system HicB family antitoxin, partial [Lachnospiraceae bacterium]|nr:type II toxin-antitoxin system HicB family antitoxin [Lachnospiraceae bacterium]
AIGIHCISAEDDGIAYANPSALSDIDVKQGAFSQEGETFLSLVDVDLTEYRRKTDNKTVRRNVTLPNWLNLEAEKAQINVSRVLQEALMAKLVISR